VITNKKNIVGTTSQKNKKFDFLPKFCFLAIPFEPEMLDGQSKALKTHIIDQIPLKTSVKKLALGIGA